MCSLSVVSLVCGNSFWRGLFVRITNGTKKTSRFDVGGKGGRAFDDLCFSQVTLRSVFCEAELLCLLN